MLLSLILIPVIFSSIFMAFYCEILVSPPHTENSDAIFFGKVHYVLGNTLQCDSAIESSHRPPWIFRVEKLKHSPSIKLPFKQSKLKIPHLLSKYNTQLTQSQAKGYLPEGSVSDFTLKITNKTNEDMHQYQCELNIGALSHTYHPKWKPSNHSTRKGMLHSLDSAEMKRIYQSLCFRPSLTEPTRFVDWCVHTFPLISTEYGKDFQSSEIALFSGTLAITPDAQPWLSSDRPLNMIIPSYCRFTPASSSYIVLNDNVQQFLRAILSGNLRLAISPNMCCSIHKWDPERLMKITQSGCNHTNNIQYSCCASQQGTDYTSTCQVNHQQWTNGPGSVLPAGNSFPDSMNLCFNSQYCAVLLVV